MTLIGQTFQPVIRAVVNRGNFFAVDFRQTMQILHRVR